MTRTEPEPAEACPADPSARATDGAGAGTGPGTGAGAADCPADCAADPAVEALVHDIIGKVADRWTMLILEVLEERGTLRFTELGRHVGRMGGGTGGTISQKMLTKTVRQMECDGLVSRTVHPVIPPRVDYALTDLGRSLGAAFCGVWIWAERNRDAVERARAAFVRR